MKNSLRSLFWTIGIVLVGIQFIPIHHNEMKKVTPSDFIELYQPPLKIRNIITIACYDCHSNQTHYPWYSNVQPLGWILQKHINEGRSELNFSEFGLLSDRKKRTKMESILKQIENDKMPLRSYTLIHTNAELSREMKKSISNYLNSLNSQKMKIIVI